MNLLLIGYGKMGRAVERIATQRGHRIIGYLDPNCVTATWEQLDINLSRLHAAIEFSTPQAAYNNIRQCLDKGIPVISGTSGWTGIEEISEYCRELSGTFFYSSNFCFGAYAMQCVSVILARTIGETHTVSIEETHHIHKKDAPSGTAISLANAMLPYLPQDNWVLSTDTDEDTKQSIPITSYRKDEVFGIHTVQYSGLHDTITLQHQALSRDAFASGVVQVMEWLHGKTGVFSMEDILK